MTDYYIGQIFVGTYPPEAAEWCNTHNCYMGDMPPQDGKIRFQIMELVQPEIDIDKLTMTALDFVTFLKQAGLTDLQIELYLQANITVKHQLEFCKDVYCGVAKALMPITYEGITITADMVEQEFKIKNGVQL
jgi:hypothetical protein